jgi:chemotaxis signal transduction protein
MPSPEPEVSAALPAAPEAAGELWTRLASIQERSACLLQVGQGRYALDGALIVEVLRPQQWTPVPRVAPAVLGLCELRGRLLGVVDPALLLEPGTQPQPLARQHSLLAIEVSGLRVALRVSRVPRLVPWLASEFEPHEPPQTGLLGALRPAEAGGEAYAVIDPNWLTAQLRALAPAASHSHLSTSSLQSSELPS